MKKFILLSTFVAATVLAFAQSVKEFSVEKTSFDPAAQKALSENPSWRNFTEKNGKWYVRFNEHTKTPATIFGEPAEVSTGGDLVSKSRYFLSNDLQALNIPVDQLELVNERASEKYHFVEFKQYYQGAEVLFSRVKVRFGLDEKVASVNNNTFPAIEIKEEPQLSAEAAKSYGATGLSFAKTSEATVNPEIKVLPFFNKETNTYDYRWVYEVYVPSGIDHFYTLVDANAGDVLYRKNLTEHFAPPAQTTVTVTGEVYITNPLDTVLTEEPLGYMKAIVDDEVIYSDVNGVFTFDITQPTDVTFILEGKWNKTVEGGGARYDAPSAQMTETINPGENKTISFTGSSQTPARNLYYHTNSIHDLMNQFMPNFKALEYPILSRFNLAGSCNAFWSGDAQNFFTPCPSAGNSNCRYVYARDVIYHEYAHGISHHFYDYFGSNFSNGGWGEGHSDVWAMMITDDPWLGKGGYCNNTNGDVRCYDYTGISKPSPCANFGGLRRQTYPRYGNLTAWQVHSVGEIIAGAWWDLRLKLGMEKMKEIFLEHLYGLPNAPQTEDGSGEGQLFFDALIDALYADDTDADLMNGTPNKEAILCAFDHHGIAFVNDISIDHLEFDSVDVKQGIVNIDVAVHPGIKEFLSDLTMHYRKNNGTWESLTLAETATPGYFRATMSAGSKGDKFDYYFQYNSTCGDSSGIYTVSGSNPTGRTLPYSANRNNTSTLYTFAVGENFVGVDDLEASNAIQVYPNPAKGHFVADLSQWKGEPAKLEIHNVLGQKVYEQSLTEKENKIDISDLRAAVYYISIKSTNGGSVFTDKLTVTK